MAGKYIDEIKSGGVMGIIGLDQWEWPSGKGDKLYELWKCEPCCGSPCNIKDALYCMVMWYCCNLCTEAKQFAGSLGQPCGIAPHLLCAWCCPTLTACMVRYNMRTKNGVKGNIIGDAVCTHCCNICSFLQVLRASGRDWDLLPCNVCVVPPQIKLLA